MKIREEAEPVEFSSIEIGTVFREYPQADFKMRIPSVTFLGNNYNAVNLRTGSLFSFAHDARVDCFPYATLNPYGA